MSTEPPVPPSAKSDLAGSRVLLLFVIALISVGALARLGQFQRRSDRGVCRRVRSALCG